MGVQSKRKMKGKSLGGADQPKVIKHIFESPRKRMKMMNQMNVKKSLENMDKKHLKKVPKTKNQSKKKKNTNEKVFKRLYSPDKNKNKKIIKKQAENVISVGDLVFGEIKEFQKSPKNQRKKGASKSKKKSSSKKKIIRRQPSPKACPPVQKSTEMSMKHFFENLENSNIKNQKPPKRNKIEKRRNGRLNNKIRELSQRLTQCSKDKSRQRVIKKHMLDQRPPPMIFSMEKSPLSTVNLQKLDQMISKKKNRRGSSLKQNDSGTKLGSSPNISQMHHKLSSIHLENKYQTQNIKDVGYYRELLKRMDLKNGTIKDPAIELKRNLRKNKSSENRQKKFQRNTADQQSIKMFRQSKKILSQSRERKSSQMRMMNSQKNIQLAKIKSEVSIKMTPLEMLSRQSNVRVKTNRIANPVQDLLSSRIMGKEDMKASITNSQLVISNKKKSFKNSSKKFKNPQLPRNLGIEIQASEKKAKGVHKMKKIKKEILKEISNRLGEQEVREILKVSDGRRLRDKQVGPSAQALLQNKGLRDKLFSQGKVSQLISNRSIKSRLNKKAKSKFLMAETGSNPSSSNLPQMNEDGTFHAPQPRERILKSSSGVGTRTQNRRKGSRKRFDLSQKQSK